MKFIYLLSSSLFLFTSCPRDIELNSNDPSFICEIEGNSFMDNTPTIDVNVSDMMSIDVSDGTYDISFRIYYFSTQIEGDVINFSVPAMGMVTVGGVTYTSTYDGPPYDGQFVFTKIESDKISGTFNFKAMDVVVGSFDKVTIMDGVFSNITY